MAQPANNTATDDGALKSPDNRSFASLMSDTESFLNNLKNQEEILLGSKNKQDGDLQSTLGRITNLSAQLGEDSRGALFDESRLADPIDFSNPEAVKQILDTPLPDSGSVLEHNFNGPQEVEEEPWEPYGQDNLSEPKSDTGAKSQSHDNRGSQDLKADLDPAFESYEKTAGSDIAAGGSLSVDESADFAFDKKVHYITEDPFASSDIEHDAGQGAGGNEEDSNEAYRKRLLAEAEKLSSKTAAKEPLQKEENSTKGSGAFEAQGFANENLGEGQFLIPKDDPLEEPSSDDPAVKVAGEVPAKVHNDAPAGDDNRLRIDEPLADDVPEETFYEPDEPQDYDFSGEVVSPELEDQVSAAQKVKEDSVPVMDDHGSRLISDGDPALIKANQRMLIEAQSSGYTLLGKRPLTCDDFLPQLQETNPYYALINEAGFDQIDLAVLMHCAFNFEDEGREKLTIKAVGPNLMAEDPAFVKRVAQKLSLVLGHDVKVTVEFTNEESKDSLFSALREIFYKKTAEEHNRIIKNKGITDICDLFKEEPGSLGVELLTDIKKPKKS